MAEWMSRWQKWQQLAWFERWLLLQALFLLALLVVALHLFAFNRVYVLLSRPLPPSLRPNNTYRLKRAQTTAALVQSAVYLLPFPVTCLPHALALWYLLRRQGIAGKLQIGVQKNADEFAAHAWVEYGGVVLNDSADVGQRFIPFDVMT
ncbi:MAG: lasso peptide biosynthesis B2 protein, partial [Anaerolineales bacterium]|nr:lasso peptide biosynthesis B2 protein [Anaerolineales bacterium]